MRISKSKRCFNVKSSTLYFHMKTKILADFQICISVPLSCKIMQKKNFFDKCLLFPWLNWICFLLSNLIWRDTISMYLLSRVNQGNWQLFEKLKGNYSLKRKKHPVRVIRENSCMLKEAATTRSKRLQIFFKIGVLKNFAIFTEKHPYWSTFFE